MSNYLLTNVIIYFFRNIYNYCRLNFSPLKTDYCCEEISITSARFSTELISISGGLSKVALDLFSCDQLYVWQLHACVLLRALSSRSPYSFERSEWKAMMGLR